MLKCRISAEWELLPRAFVFNANYTSGKPQQRGNRECSNLRGIGDGLRAKGCECEKDVHFYGKNGGFAILCLQMKLLKLAPLVRFSVDHPIIVLVLTAVITSISLIPLSNLKVESDVEKLLRTSDSVITQTANYDRVALRIAGSGLYTLKGLAIFGHVIEDVSARLDVESAITPFNMMTLENSNDRLRVVNMSAGSKNPKNPGELDDFIDRINRNPFSKGFIQSADGKELVAYFLIPKSTKYREQEDSLLKIISSYEGELERSDLKIAITGSIPFSAETERYITSDSINLLALVIATILLSYYMGFRSRRAMFIPVVVVIVATVWSLSFISLMDWKLTIVNMVAPPLVLILGSSYSIHILNEYYRLPVDYDKRRKIIEAVTGVSGTITMAAITTVIALLCLLIATMEQTREFAIATSFGVVFTALLSTTVFPAMLCLQKPVGTSRIKLVNAGFIMNYLEKFAPGIKGKFWLMLIIFLSLLVASFFIVPRISFNTSPFSYFPAKSKVITDINEFVRKVGGGDELAITIKAPDKEKNYFLNGDILSRLYRIEKRLAVNPDVSHSMSLPSYISFAYNTMGREENFESKGFNSLVSRALFVANGALGNLFSNEDLTETYLRVRVYNNAESRNVDEKDSRRIKSMIQNILSEELPETLSWDIRGIPLEFLELSESIRRDFQYSTLLALLAIGIFCSISFRSVFCGLMALIPIITGIAATFILMSIFGIPLDMTTVMMSCVVIGVGVDDAIHLMIRYKEELHQQGRSIAVENTIIKTGRPIILTTLSIILGLSWFGLAEFQPISYFGMLIAFTLAATCFATLFILPPIIVRLVRK